MTRSGFLIGVIILAAAAAGIYFDDTTIRIAAGGVFLVGAVFLYYVLSGRSEEEGEGAETTDGARSADGGASAAPAADGDAATADGQPPRARRPHARGDGEIPGEYYLPQDGAAVSDDPREEFDFLTNKLLGVLKDHLVAYTVGLFWINNDRKQIVIGEYLTDARSFTTARRLALGSDLVSRIGTSGRPAILSEIAAGSERDLLPYYDALEGIQSFVGVPLFFMDEPIAVVAADSTAPDAFGKETVAAIGRVTALTSTLLQSYNQKFDLAADSKLLGVLDRMKRTIHAHMDMYGIASAAAAAVTEILDWDFVSVILFHPDKQNWTVVKSLAKTANLPYVSEGVTVAMEGSILRDALDHYRGQILAAPKPPHFRFHEKEMLGTDGELCVVPFARSKRNPGLLVVEYRENAQYAQHDLDVLTHIADMAGTYFDVVRLQDLARRHLMIDEESGVSSRALFLQRLGEETARIKAHGGDAVLLLAGVDGPEDVQARHGSAGLQTILHHTARLLRDGVQPFDAVGKFDQHRFGVLLLPCTAEDAYLRCEKLRKAIASHIVYHEGVSFSVTASIAGCAITPGFTVEQVLRVAQQAMDRAIADGGNCVKVV